MAQLALIIGNGFDIDMGIPSKYSDFIRSKEWQGVVKRVEGFLADSSYRNHSLVAQLQLASMDSMWFDIEHSTAGQSPCAKGKQNASLFLLSSDVFLVF